MRKTNFILTTAFLMACSVFASAQSKSTIIKSDKAQVTMTSNEGQTVKQINDHVVVTYPNREPQRNNPDGRETVLLEIKPTFSWKWIEVYNGSDYDDVFSDWDGEYYSREIPEGTYDILVEGTAERDGEFVHVFLNYEDVEITENMTMTPEGSEANKCIYLDATDENGTPLSQVAELDESAQWNVFFNWNHLGNHSYVLLFYPLNQICDKIIHLYYNGFSNKSELNAMLQFATEGQKIYTYVTPKTDEWLEGDLHFTINGDELVAQEEYFNVEGMENVQFGMGFDNNNFSNGNLTTEAEIFDSKLPVTNLTNLKADALNPQNFYWQINTLVGNFESDYENQITTMPRTVNSNGIWTWDPLCLDNLFVFRDYNFETGTTPCAYQLPTEAPVYYGFRAPMYFFHSATMTSAESPWGGETTIDGKFYSLGENGSLRNCDQDEIVSVTVDGEEIFNDVAYYFGYLPSADGLVNMEVTNDHVLAYDVNMTNHTQIEFDLRKEDHHAPTMTFLQVTDAYGTEQVVLESLDGAYIRFGAGDFGFDVNQYVYPYMSKPDVEVFYSVNGGAYQTLEIVENEDLFHSWYGNVFDIDLSQLEDINNAWVDFKFVVTDEAGNFQTQELCNLFYVGEMTSVAEANTLAHSVYPNPFTSEVRINAAETVNGNASISVFNVLGEQVYNCNMNCNDTKEFVIDGSSLNAGIYFYNIATENGELKGRIVKE